MLADFQFCIWIPFPRHASKFYNLDPKKWEKPPSSSWTCSFWNSLGFFEVTLPQLQMLPCCLNCSQMQALHLQYYRIHRTVWVWVYRYGFIIRLSWVKAFAWTFIMKTTSLFLFIFIFSYCLHLKYLKYNGLPNLYETCQLHRLFHLPTDAFCCWAAHLKTSNYGNIK